MEASSSASFAGTTIVAIVCALSTPHAVHAQDASTITGPRVALEVEACAGIDPEIVHRILGIELGADADLDALPTDPEASRVRATCADAEGTRVALAVDEPLTAKHLERSIDLVASPESGRSRLVALALAELLAASWIELGMRRDPEVVEVGAQGGDEARAVALAIARERMPGAEVVRVEETPRETPRARPFGVRAIGVGRVSGDPLHFSGGGGLGVDLELYAPLAMSVDVRGEQGSVTVGESGLVRMTVAWTNALLALRVPFGLHHADFGLGGRAGYGWMVGEGERGIGGAEQSGPLLGVVTATHISLHIVASAYLHVGIELAWITLPLYGTLGSSGETVARIGDGQLSITLGFEVRPE
ncbi:hypothetical protein [Sandaracinus amylolyticus]|uniref:hypothetical protein n=1 Tax=Sandaracinus amylolyticus TaxID=927083 RepID=UPI001F24A7CF|nr:hypothetical protein [Sandaracinus amylolyticus]UJR78397.1 Hypothetical protein I5071_4240 [Sandaracinus amylolyticus]